MPPTPASEAESAPPVVASRPAIDLRRLVLLIAFSVVAAGALWYGFAQGENPRPTMPDGSPLLWLVVALMIASAAAVLVAPRTRDRQGLLPRLVHLTNAIPLIWYLLATACIASFAIAQVANTRPMPGNYWPLFAVWLVVVGSILAWVAAGTKWTGLRLATLRASLLSRRWEMAAVVALTVAAVTVRIVNLSSLPGPYEQDEAALAHQSLNALEGQTPNMFMSGLQGHATMQHYSLAAVFKIFGVTIFSSRLLSALTGAITVPLLYLLLRRMFGNTVALLGAAYLVAYHFHVHYSRVGLENIGDPFILVAVLYFAWRASREGKTRDFVLTGLVMGLGLYLSPAARVVPLIVAALFGYTFLRRPRFLRQAAPGMGVLTLAYGAAALPIAVFWITHQADFMDRVNIVGIYQSHWIDNEQLAKGKSQLAILWDQAVHSFGAFGRFADSSQHYLAPVSFVDHLSLVPFLVGLGYSIYKVLEERYFLLLAAFVAIVVTGGVLTIEAPTSQRLVGTTVIVAAFVAIGLKLIADSVSRWRPSGSYVVAGVGICALLAVNVHSYFWDYRTGGYYTDYNTYVAAQVVEYAKTLPADTRLFWYGAPKIYLSGSGHPSMTFPLRDYARFDVMTDGRVASTEEAEGDAPSVFMFMSHREEEIQPLMDSCPGGEIKTFIIKAGRHGINGIQKTDEISFVAYEVLTPNQCLPVTAGQ
jgi:4-amino-4-deoxy-L-arabinose transferase-like glycosyltransferase